MSPSSPLLTSPRGGIEITQQPPPNLPEGRD